MPGTFGLPAAVPQLEEDEARPTESIQSESVEG